jgi:KUP system potassium uptake protein
MEAAYGLTINITMLMTTVLLSIYLYQRRFPKIFIGILLFTYLLIEGTFLYANLNKFAHGGWFTLLLGGFIFMTMYVWYSGRRIRNKFIEFVRLEDYFELIKALSKDQSIPKCATNLVFMTKAGKPHEIESKIIYLMLHKQPKRADVYWLVHVEILDEPYTNEYKITQLLPGQLIRVDFRIGFKVQPRVNLFFRKVVEEMASRDEIDLLSRYESIRKYDILGDFRFVIIDRVQNYDIEFRGRDQFFLDLFDFLKKFSISEVRAMGLDASNVATETVPMSVIIDIPGTQQPVH